MNLRLTSSVGISTKLSNLPEFLEDQFEACHNHGEKPFRWAACGPHVVLCPRCKGVQAGVPQETPATEEQREVARNTSGFIDQVSDPRHMKKRSKTTKSLARYVQSRPNA